MFDLMISNPPYQSGLYRKILSKLEFKQLTIICPWDLVTATREGKELKNKLNGHATIYKRITGMIFRDINPVQLFMGNFNLLKKGKELNPINENDRLESSVFKKIQSYKYQLKDYVYWKYIPQKVQCKTTIELERAYEKLKEFINSSYNHQILVSMAAVRRRNKILTKPDEIRLMSGFGIKNKEGLDLITKSVNSEDWKTLLRVVTLIVGDGLSLYQRDVNYMPLFEKWGDLGLTKEEINWIYETKKTGRN